MIKMYNAEVLSKFPVVQHFPFGSLFSWDIDPTAAPPATSTHVASQPSSHTVSVTGDTGGAPQSRPLPQEGTRAPWASSAAPVVTAAPWANKPSQPQGLPPTQAPWPVPGSTATAGGGLPSRTPPSHPQGMPLTRAPWAKPPNKTGDNMGR